jgi:YbgC/YbaW family acyl-CoA thioester hydrolase
MPSAPPAFVHRRSVEFHETDQAGIAHFSNLFRWMESAELAFLRDHKIPIISSVAGAERGWPRASACAQFKAPLRFGDEIETRLWVRSVGRACVRYGFEIWRVSGSAEPELAATGELASVHASRTSSSGSLRPQPLPPATRAKLAIALTPDDSAGSER